MKYLVVGLLTLLSVLPKAQLLGSEPGCSKRYLRRINGKCYYFSVKKLNWFGALNNCLRKGLTLADLSNAEDFYGAINFLSSKGNVEDFWFGGNDLHTEGRFQYISSGRLVKFFSNYSILDPSERADCDDCLEVRIRSNLSVVADDSCLERQYFICSERYCTSSGTSGKPRHHSHEHLHHFHHDIGPEDDEGSEQDTSSPADSASVENAANDSEGAIGQEDLSETNPITEISDLNTENIEATNNDTFNPEVGKTRPIDGSAENGTTSSPSGDDDKLPSPGGPSDELSPSAPANPDEASASPEGEAATTPAANTGETSPSPGAATTPAETPIITAAT